MAVDVLLVSLASTHGWRVADAALAGALERTGASVAVVEARKPREVRTFALTDLGWALAARRAAIAGLREHRPRAVLYSTTTAALLWPRPGAVRFDALAAGSRPGRHGLWQRERERAVLDRAPLLVPMAATAFAEALQAVLDAQRLARDPAGQDGEHDDEDQPVGLLAPGQRVVDAEHQRHQAQAEQHALVDPARQAPADEGPDRGPQEDRRDVDERAGHEAGQDDDP